ncbi:MAG: IS1634 family transposase [Peptococcaceae bacterium]|nr:IS1634 family transposase [Peptococcaceae bacterium]
MFARVKSRKNKDGTVREYLQIVENKRVDGKTQQKVICTLGRLDELREGELDRLIDSLAKYTERRAILDGAQELFATWSKEYGAPIVFRRLWEKIGLATILDDLVSHTRIEYKVSETVFAMVLNRLMDPQSKIQVAEWACEDVYEPRFESLQPHHYYRALDFLSERKKTIEEQLFLSENDLFNRDLDIVFFDTTSTYFEGRTDGELAQYGFSKDHRPDRKQVVLGLLMKRDGTPIAHEVLPGNTSDIKAFLQTIKDCRHRFNIRRVIMVADRGMISKSTIKALEAAGYEYIIGTRMRRDKEVADEVLSRGGRYQKVAENLEVKNVVVIDDETLDERRYIVCYNPGEAEREAKVRETVIAKLKTKIKENGVKSLVGNSAYRKYLNIESENVTVNDAKIQEEARYDGKYILRTNTDLAADEAAKAYKQLWMVERAFRELKGQLKLRPMYHWTDERIRGHIMVCFLAFYLECRLRQLLKDTRDDLTYDKVLKDLGRLKAIRLRVNGKNFIARTELAGDAYWAFKAVGVRVPPQVLEL